MPLGILTGLARAMRRKRTSSLDILSSKRAPRNYYKGKNCKPAGFHTRKGGYVLVQEKLPNYVVPELTDLKLKPYVSQCPINVDTTEANVAAKGQFLIAASAMSADSRGSRPARVFKDSRQRHRCYGTIGIVLRSSLTKLGFVVHMGVVGGRAAVGLLLISHILPC